MIEDWFAELGEEDRIVTSRYKKEKRYAMARDT